eukprot:484893-Prymnesium_polylepis.1
MGPTPPCGQRGVRLEIIRRPRGRADGSDRGGFFASAFAIRLYVRVPRVAPGTKKKGANVSRYSKSPEAERANLT